VDIGITVDGATPESLILDLESWLMEQPGEWDRVNVIAGDVESGALGPLVDAIQLVLGSAGTISSVASVIIAWLQYRKDDVTVTLKTPSQDSPAQVSAHQAADNSSAAADELIAWLEEAWLLESGEDGDDDA
jgi:Effector Associated Constant Component 1